MHMIDKLEVRVPRSVPYRPAFAELYRQIAWEDAERSIEGLPRRITPSRYYESVVDLREFGNEVILHNSARLGKNGDYKIELLETGKMGFSHMIQEIEEIFDVDPEALSVTRVDLTADVFNIPVSWFVKHCRVQYKRWIASMGHISDGAEFSEMGIKRIETLYLGKRPNLIRIYDKVAEHLHQFKKILRQLSPDAELPDFEQVYGISPDTIMTRVERQLAAGRVPPPVDTVRKLRTADSFNPFHRLKIIEGCALEPNPLNYRSDVYERGIRLRQLVEDEGLQRARFALNEQSQGNADRILKTVSDFIPSDGQGITAEELFERYQDSTRKQLIA